MNTLKLYKRAEWYLDATKANCKNTYDIEKNRIFVCIGEFSHAPGHVLMCEFGTWKLSGMHDFDTFEEIDDHPDTLVVTIG